MPCVTKPGGKKKPGTKKPGTKKMRMVAYTGAFLLCLTMFVGCTSTKAAVIRNEYAMDMQYMLRDNAEAQKKQIVHFIDRNAQAEIDRLNMLLVMQNERAGNRVDRVATNYINYYAAMEKLRKDVANERMLAESRYAESIALAQGYRALARMTDEELKLPQGVAEAAIAAAISSAEQLWTVYQQQNEVPVPDEPEPTPAPEPIIEYVEVPAPAPTPAPAPVAPVE